MECVLGRKLAEHEIVVHKDGNALNDNPENLLLTDAAGSTRFHRYREGRPSFYTVDSLQYKVCPKCFIAKDPRTEFHQVKGKPNNYCRVCWNQKQKDFYRRRKVAKV